MTMIRAISDDSRFMFVWTDQHVEQLRKLADDKRSASEIAKEIGGGVSRCAVIGKATRLGIKIDSGARGLSREKTPRPPVGKTAAKSVSVAKSPTQPKPPRTKLKSDGALASYFAPTQPKLRPEPDAQPIRVTIAELTAEHCRWPLGDPSDLDSFRYCGARVDLRGIVPYCAGHCRTAYARAA